ncbi:anti-sigma B factor RsbW [Brevibacillus invocatus]|uniref:Serine-protein kinase RsbW n=1 Tax=Brevibacillus invocatus TaxID=173959 RepID=A0A3M8C3T8_9BACL|nr:anti-sigma B factor RsbW [Brevibacillus invocatus]RNB70362.1 anti-sigma B factor RsbW [Brevibacillus invocatus]
MDPNNPSADVIQLTLPNRVEYLGVARLLVSGVANRMGFSYEDIEDIKLAVGEACTNAVEHAYEQEDGTNSLHLECRVYEDRLVIEVADQGKGFSVESAKKQATPLYSGIDQEDLVEGGLGLYLIHALMDEVVFHTDAGVSVSMTKYLRRDGVAGDDRTISKNQI